MTTENHTPVNQTTENHTRTGLIHVYTGDGKGKTTAALGLAIRALGAGWKVLFAQFLKGQPSSELNTLSRLAGQIEVIRYGGTGFIRGQPSPADREAARKGMAEVTEIMRRGDFDLVILDEANMALHYQLISLDQLQQAIQEGAPATELVLTGRNAPRELLEIADLVTEMRAVKHYFAKGIKARIGIEY